MILEKNLERKFFGNVYRGDCVRHGTVVFSVKEGFVGYPRLDFKIEKIIVQLVSFLESFANIFVVDGTFVKIQPFDQR